MQYAIVQGQRAEAMPGGRGLCPVCEGDVVARCGEINAWHWAHVQRCDCDGWSEGETDWHLTWKRRFPRQWREVVIGAHRADIKSPQGVIELQSSSISPAEIACREDFYCEMIWLLDARAFRLVVRDRGSHVTFRWKHPRKTWWTAEKQLYFDLGDRLIKIHRIYEDLPCGGSGTFVSYADFVAAFSKPKPGQKLCEACKTPHPRQYLTETGMYEYYTMDLDPGTVMCPDCYESRRDRFIPDDPELWDCYTPLRTV
jgi:competence protein CoiA